MNRKTSRISAEVEHDKTVLKAQKILHTLNGESIQSIDRILSMVKEWATSCPLAIKAQ